MSLLARARTLLARHPSVYWAAVALLLVPALRTLDDRADAAAAARAEWAETRTVWVAAVDHRPGDALQVTTRTLPLVAVPVAALVDEPAGLAMQAVGLGEVVTVADVGDERFDLLPDGWQAVAVDLRPPAPDVRAGDHVSVVDLTGVLVERAVVIQSVDGVALVGVPADIAPAAAVAAQAGTVALTIRRP